jgi:hypothetical protein
MTVVIDPGTFANTMTVVIEQNGWFGRSRSIATHNPEQVFYYGADFIQRRMDYSVEVNGDALVAEHQYKPKTFQGFVFHTQRRAHRRCPDGTSDHIQTSITLDITDIEIDSDEQPSSTEP